ncbi:hypothetical protein TEA_012616 [Camellia sinensis var. sinensis]|uniref:Uncharacterized protein n=1 Tax=Camellia sinensis var. sinensis TaxID=542762 RepID=A0A4S4F0Q7_CAMSN|nr:hypothetical protein TEA_012616 [Camellia sinensis var. sinensis]
MGSSFAAVHHHHSEEIDLTTIRMSNHSIQKVEITIRSKNCSFSPGFGTLKLMVLGFISLLLTFGQHYIANICIPIKLADTMFPCPMKHPPQHHGPELNLPHEPDELNAPHEPKHVPDEHNLPLDPKHEPEHVAEHHRKENIFIRQ